MILRPSRDCAHIADIVDIITRSLDRSNDYEICDFEKGSRALLSDFIALVKKYDEKKVLVKTLPNKTGNVPYMSANDRKVDSSLGCKVKASFEENIKRAVQ